MGNSHSSSSSSHHSHQHTNAHPGTGQPTNKITRTMSAFTYSDVPQNLLPYSPSLSQCEGDACIFNYLYAHNNNSIQFECVSRNQPSLSSYFDEEQERRESDGDADVLALLQAYRPKALNGEVSMRVPVSGTIESLLKWITIENLDPHYTYGFLFSYRSFCYNPIQILDIIRKICQQISELSQNPPSVQHYHHDNPACSYQLLQKTNGQAFVKWCQQRLIKFVTLLIRNCTTRELLDPIKIPSTSSHGNHTSNSSSSLEHVVLMTRLEEFVAQLQSQGFTYDLRSLRTIIQSHQAGTVRHLFRTKENLRKSPNSISPTTRRLIRLSSDPCITKGSPSKMNFTCFSPHQIANQMHLIEFNMFSKICVWTEFNSNAVSDSSAEDSMRKWTTTKSPGIAAMITRFNTVSYWVATSIVTTTSSTKKQAKTITMFINAALECRRLNNFNSLMEILAGLNMWTVSQLEEAWKMVPDKAMEVKKDLEKCMASEGNFRAYRQTISSLYHQLQEGASPSSPPSSPSSSSSSHSSSSSSSYSPSSSSSSPFSSPPSSPTAGRNSYRAPITAPVLPYLGVYLRDITFINEMPDVIAPRKGSDEPPQNSSRNNLKRSGGLENNNNNHKLQLQPVTVTSTTPSSSTTKSSTTATTATPTSAPATTTPAAEATTTTTASTLTTALTNFTASTTALTSTTSLPSLTSTTEALPALATSRSSSSLSAALSAAASSSSSLPSSSSPPKSLVRSPSASAPPPSPPPEAMINFAKMRLMGSVLVELHTFQCQQIDIEEEAIVHNYLTNLITMDEDTLYACSKDFKLPEYL